MCVTQSKLLTTKDVSKVLGVSESSVKRWIDDGSLRAEKTPGGHRRIALNDLDIFIRSTGRKTFDTEPLGITNDINFENFAEVYKKYYEALRVGDSFMMDAIVRRLSLTGSSIESIIDRLVNPAFVELRNTCHHPSEECLVLHRALDITRRVLENRQNQAAKKNRSKPIVIFADIGYEVDGLPTYLAETAVKDVISTFQLGVGVPVDVSAGAVSRSDAKGFFLSASGPITNKKNVDSTAKKIFEACEANEVPCYIYGDFFAGHNFEAFPAVQAIESFSEFRGAIKNLRP